MSQDPAASRNYRRRKATLERVQDRLRVEHHNWHQPWTRTTVPSAAVRELIDELYELAGGNEL